MLIIAWLPVNSREIRGSFLAFDAFPQKAQIDAGRMLIIACLSAKIREIRGILFACDVYPGDGAYQRMKDWYCLFFIFSRFMELLVYFTAFLIMISKYLDCLTTSRKMSHISQEQNPMVRVLMQKLGPQATIWGIFALTLLILMESVWLVLYFDPGNLIQMTFVFIGLIVAGIQFGVAHTNHTQRSNQLTRLLLKIYNR